MSNIPITSLPVAITLDGSEEVPIVQGGTTKRTTTGDIGNTATGFVPTTRTINTPTAGGLTGGGSLASDLTLYWAPANLNPKTAMVVADTFAINDSAIGDPAQVTFPNAMKALTGLSALALPSATNDYLIINRGSDGQTYKINPSSLSLGTGNLPSGGTIGQPLIKQSGTDYDAIWATLPVIGGGTGQITNTNHGILLGQGASSIVATAAMTDGQLLIGQTGADPSPQTVSGDVTISNLGVMAIENNKVTDAMLRQSSGLSVIGRSASTTGNVADIVGTADQILRVAALGASLGFGSIDLSKSAAVGSSILGFTNGGTGQSTYAIGDTLYASAANTLSKLAGNITSGIQYLSQTGTGAASAAPIWATISGGDITGAALTRVDDTNVTLTLSGTPSTALLRAASITAGWSGQLSPARGGTGVNNGTNTLTLGGNLTTSGAFATTMTMTGATSVTFPTAGTLATLPGTPVTSGSTSISVTAGTKILALTQVAPTATAIALPSVASQNGVPLQIVDWSTGVTDHAITITPNGSEKIMQQATFPIYSNSSQLASITLWPSVALSGWYTAP